jgi:hypothetical protein
MMASLISALSLEHGFGGAYKPKSYFMEATRA